MVVTEGPIFSTNCTAKATVSSVKEKILFSLSQNDGRKALEYLLKVARNEKNTELRKKAIFWIGQSGDDEAAKFLQQLIDQD